MIYLMLTILVITIALFVWGKFTPDIVALLSMISLFLTGILDAKETLSGFSNPTVIMIAALFIIGEGLSQTGWTALAGRKFVEWAGKSIPKLLVIVSLGSGILSGFVSNTGTVATLMPLTISSAWSIGTLPSKMLMPVAFGSNTGGLLTLTGTPPNIIASNALVQSGHEGFSFFEFGLIGLPLLIIALVYFRYVGYKLLPKNKTSNKPIDIETTFHKWIEAYRIDGDYYRLRIRSVSPLIDTKIGIWDFEKNYNISILRLKRRHPSPLKGISQFVEFPDNKTFLRYHDIITVKGSTEDINKLMIKFRLGLLPLEPVTDELKNNLINQEVGMTEVIVNPNSILVGRKYKLGDYFKRFGIQLLAASRNNKPLTDKEITVKVGDAFLLRGSWENIESLKEQHENLVICGSPEGMAKNVDNLNSKSYIALGALILMIGLLVFKVVPGSMAALICAGIVLLTGCVPMSKAYKGISWTSVVMIAAMIPMGIALQKTGTAQMVANGLVTYLGSISPVMLLGGIFLLTTTFSQVINNSATAVLMAPIAILAASSLGVSPEPFMIVVAISASTAFLTPVGTTTNAMVMSAGGYKFMDYLKVGAPLLLVFFIVSLLLVPIIWPF
ncbi:anion permease ArsB/NhaD-like [Jejuia pallidilutea]|uniref:Anion permease ArsB/NhaD-like n=2 Tax=Jejuia pallidilutea TaxID=504487 RepID=A0A090VTB8_9FLAO|nr:citrate transporter [Jejuia pallidilutea]GAL67965.1 anion permease ArsB/NhaD-like [Jejuia pallidilutea]GAL72194.1 anion permease ArsB/NhaD-like [Jejuia pallidilutea]GAL89293.1 anion permease ArsB/NhaD-like [Jejuia pallidilutea]